MISVSVVIPFYSGLTGVLKNAVLSALNQTIHNIEVIVIDDCSPISANNELATIKDTRLRIVCHKENSNGGIARNTGIDEARGEFIAFLDYDDIWYRDKLEQQLNLFKEVELQTSNPVVYSRCKIIDGARVVIRPTRSIFEDELVGDYLFCSKQIIQTSGIFLKTSVAKLVRFDDLKRHQDYQFCLALEKFGCKFFMLDKPSYEFIQIPKLNDFTYSLNWLENYNFFLSEKAKVSFRQLVVLRSMISANEFFLAAKFARKNRFCVFFVKSTIIKLIKVPLKFFGYLK